MSPPQVGGTGYGCALVAVGTTSAASPTRNEQASRRWLARNPQILQPCGRAGPARLMCAILARWPSLNIGNSPENHRVRTVAHRSEASIKRLFTTRPRRSADLG